MRYSVAFTPLKGTGALNIEMLEPENNGPVFEANDIGGTVVVVNTVDGNVFRVFVTATCTANQCLYSFKVYDAKWNEIEKGGTVVDWGKSETVTMLKVAKVDVIIYQDIPTRSQSANDDTFSFVDLVG